MHPIARRFHVIRGLLVPKLYLGTQLPAEPKRCVGWSSKLRFARWFLLFTLCTALLAAQRFRPHGDTSIINNNDSAPGSMPGTCPQPITQSTSLTITPGNSVSCNNGTGQTDNSYWRAFNMETFTGGDAFRVFFVLVGIESVNNPQPITVRLYLNNGGAFPGGTRTLLDSQTVNVTSAQTGGVTPITFSDLPLVPAGTEELVMELFTPDGQAAGNLFFIGSNAEPETGPSYLSAPDCGITTPTTMAALGFPNMHIVFRVDPWCEGTPPPPPTPTATATATSTPTASPAPLIVTTMTDSGPGSLRQIIAEANDGDTIQFDPSLNGQTISLTSGQLSISRTLTIDGPGAGQLAVSRTTTKTNFRIFEIMPGHTVTIQGLTISNGTTADTSSSGPYGSELTGGGRGGGIYNNGSTLTIANCTITGNHAGFGAGIFNDTAIGAAQLTINNSIVSGNSADVTTTGSGSGGGIFNYGQFYVARLLVNDCTISGNGAELGGGGIVNDGATAFLSVTNSTMSNNSTNLRGGGISNSAVMEMSNTTISGNSAHSYGGGFYGGGSIKNSTISENTALQGGGIYVYDTSGLLIQNTIWKTGATGVNFFNNGGTITSSGYNLSSDNGGGFLTGPGDLINTDPLLGPLQDNGGPTFTHELLKGSPAINAGNPNFTPPPSTDQRGFPRVYNGRIDIGSVEVQPGPSPTATPTATATATATATPGPCVGSNWSTTVSGPDTTPNCVFHDAPGCVTDSTLDTPVFMSGIAHATEFYFRHSYDFEEGHDGGVLEISINGGPFVDIIEAGGAFPLHGYNGTITTGTFSPIAGRHAWTGNSGGYIDSYADLPQAAAFQNVRMRFRLATDCSGTGNGWRVDTISALYPIGCPPVTPTPTPCDPWAHVFAENFDNVTAPALPAGWVTSFNVGPTNCVPTPTSTPSTVQALNISTRLRIETGDNVGIGGFIISGSGNLRVAIRGLGPSLGQLGVPDFLVDPILPGLNDNWQDDPAQAAQLMKLGLAPTNPLESAAVLTLPAGAHTAMLAGKNGGTGVGLIEIYNVDQSVPLTNIELGNISTRGFVATDSNVMIGGFILGNGTPNPGIVVRGIGPSLSQFGVPGALADPTLELYDNNGVSLVINDNWQDDPLSAAQLTAHGLAPQNPLEAGIYAELQPGLYTAILAGKDGGSGVGLVEIYNVH